jgi:four helix bundle protein
MGDFKKLVVWQEARKLTKGVFKAAERFEGPSRDILRRQICRAVLSIPSNIAEGSAKSGDREFARFLKMSRGSLAELESHLIIAGDLEVLTEKDQAQLLSHVEKVFRILNPFLERVLLSAEQSDRAKPRSGRRKRRDAEQQ